MLKNKTKETKVVKWDGNKAELKPGECVSVYELGANKGDKALVETRIASKYGLEIISDKNEDQVEVSAKKAAEDAKKEQARADEVAEKILEAKTPEDVKKLADNDKNPTVLQAVIDRLNALHDEALKAKDPKK